jgi:4'-phosphopantetheinyl transferase
MSAWRALPRSQRAEAFLRLWSRKEASLKLNGRGLFDITERIPSAQETKALDEASLWPRFSVPHTESIFHELTPAAGYVGALALAVPEVVRS